MFNHSITTGYADEGGNVQTVINKYAGQTEKGFDGTITAGATNSPITLSWTITAMQSFMMWSSQALTVKTNSSSSPAQTFSLAANQEVVWGTLQGTTNPITLDVTQLFVTNAGSVDSQFKVRVLLT
jgi:hypothetical protein